MKIAFDAIPLLGRKSGIGWCEAGQVSALTRMLPWQEKFSPLISPAQL